LGLLSLTLPAQEEHGVIKHCIFVHLSVCHLSAMSHTIMNQMVGVNFTEKHHKLHCMQDRKKNLSFSPVAKHQCLHQGRNTKLILLKGPGEPRKNILQCW